MSREENTQIDVLSHPENTKTNDHNVTIVQETLAYPAIVNELDNTINILDATG